MKLFFFPSYYAISLNQFFLCFSFMLSNINLFLIFLIRLLIFVVLICSFCMLQSIIWLLLPPHSTLPFFISTLPSFIPSILFSIFIIIIDIIIVVTIFIYIYSNILHSHFYFLFSSFHYKSFLLRLHLFLLHACLCGRRCTFEASFILTCSLPIKNILIRNK